MGCCPIATGAIALKLYNFGNGYGQDALHSQSGRDEKWSLVGYNLVWFAALHAAAASGERGSPRTLMGAPAVSVKQPTTPMAMAREPL